MAKRTLPVTVLVLAGLAWLGSALGAQLAIRAEAPLLFQGQVLFGFRAETGAKTIYVNIQVSRGGAPVEKLEGTFQNTRLLQPTMGGYYLFDTNLHGTIDPAPLPGDEIRLEFRPPRAPRPLAPAHTLPQPIVATARCPKPMAWVRPPANAHVPAAPAIEVSWLGGKSPFWLLVNRGGAVVFNQQGIASRTVSLDGTLLPAGNEYSPVVYNDFSTFTFLPAKPGAVFRPDPASQVKVRLMLTNKFRVD